MEQQQLVDMLRRLHTELAKTKRADPETLSLLETLTEDIDRVIGKRQAEEGESAEEEESAAGVLQKLLLKFESEHPELATTIGKIADGLAAMGF